jgi:hypothetical protein
LPDELVTRKLVASLLTDSQRWKFQYTLGTSLYGQMGSTLLSINKPTVELVGNMVRFKAPGYDLFKTSLKPQYWFGIPRNVVIDGLVMDVDHIEHQVVEKNNDQEQWKAWNRASGARMSAMEHLMPEMMFSTADNPAHGISAVKALQLAAAEGQKIWAITQTNLNTALAAINLRSDIETDIRNSVNAGKEVTAHEAAVDFYGSNQVGYIVIDPETGAGGYLIGGGENGGKLAAHGAGYALGMLGVLIGGTLATGGLAAFPAVIPLAVGLFTLLNILAVFTIVSVIIDDNLSALDAFISFGCGLIMSLAMTGVAMLFMRVSITAFIDNFINYIGGGISVLGYVAGVCA